MKVSIIISTYNRPDALTLCLESLLRQTVMPDEILIGDDGSDHRTAEVIQHYQQLAPVPLRHIWQEDKGFRLAMSRNRCIASAQGDYIIETDGDLIFHKQFVADHITFAEKGWYIKGGRVNTTKEKAQALCLKQKYQQLDFFSSGLTRRINAIRCLPIARYLSKRRKTASGLGCNMSFWKEDTIRINGYDEFYEGWGGEDHDFGTRMQKSGIKKKSLKFAGIVFHLWHNDLYMDNKEKNFSHLHDIEKGTGWRCKSGIDQYLQQD